MKASSDDPNPPSPRRRPGGRRRCRARRPHGGDHPRPAGRRVPGARPPRRSLRAAARDRREPSQHGAHAGLGPRGRRPLGRRRRRHPDARVRDPGRRRPRHDHRRRLSHRSPERGDQSHGARLRAPGPPGGGAVRAPLLAAGCDGPHRRRGGRRRRDAGRPAAPSRRRVDPEVALRRGCGRRAQRGAVVTRDPDAWRRSVARRDPRPAPRPALGCRRAPPLRPVRDDRNRSRLRGAAGGRRPLADRVPVGPGQRAPRGLHRGPPRRPHRLGRRHRQACRSASSGSAPSRSPLWSPTASGRATCSSPAMPPTGSRRAAAPG